MEEADEPQAEEERRSWTRKGGENCLSTWSRHCRCCSSVLGDLDCGDVRIRVRTAQETARARTYRGEADVRRRRRGDGAPERSMRRRGVGRYAG